VGITRHQHQRTEDVVVSFFFSSRRRHTRSKRDWSSDVCSSDLCCNNALPSLRLDIGLANDLAPPLGILGEEFCKLGGRAAYAGRSEERRVGKECRCRWWREHEREKRCERVTGSCRTWEQCEPGN